MDLMQWLRASGTAALDSQRAETTDPGWKRRDDVRFLYNMQVKCPWCGVNVETRRIWLVSENRRQVLKVWAIKTGTLVPVARAHPHVHRTNGGICMGDSSDAVQALTMGVNPGNPYWQVSLFFKQIGHVCAGVRDDNYSRTGNNWRLSSEPLPSEGEGGESTTTCADCGESGVRTKKVKGLDRRVCSNCWDHMHYRCDFCSGEMYIGEGSTMVETHDGDVCPPCVEKHFFTCERCRRLRTNRAKSGYTGGTWCTACW